MIYVSPLKSLAGDIRENLRKPLEGIEAEALEENRFRPESEEPGEGTPGGGPGKQSIGRFRPPSVPGTRLRKSARGW